MAQLITLHNYTPMICVFIGTRNIVHLLHSNISMVIQHVFFHVYHYPFPSTCFAFDAYMITHNVTTTNGKEINVHNGFPSHICIQVRHHISCSKCFHIVVYYTFSLRIHLDATCIPLVFHLQSIQITLNFHHCPRIIPLVIHLHFTYIPFKFHLVITNGPHIFHLPPHLTLTNTINHINS
jgi:hypothetical protein